MNIETQKENLLTEERMLADELSLLGTFDKVKNDWETKTINTQDENTSDENDMADRAEAFETDSATMTVLEERYHDVKDALTKIENNTYGICEICAASIEEDRLEVNPASRTCKGCMNK